MQNLFTEKISQTTVFLGTVGSNTYQQIGTGVLVNFQGIIHLVTAKHVVLSTDGREREDLSLYITTDNSTTEIRPLKSLLNQLSIKWIYSEDDKSDIAVLPCPIRHGDPLICIDENQFAESSMLCDLVPIVFVTYDPRIQVLQNPLRPMYRQGCISYVFDEEHILLDGTTYPGNSGSPVYILPNEGNFAEHVFKIYPDNPGGRLLGIVSSYVFYQDIAISPQTKRPRITFEENSSLTNVCSVIQLLRILSSNDSRKQIEWLYAHVDSLKQKGITEPLSWDKYKI